MLSQEIGEKKLLIQEGIPQEMSKLRKEILQQMSDHQKNCLKRRKGWKKKILEKFYSSIKVKYHRHRAENRIREFLLEKIHLMCMGGVNLYLRRGDIDFVSIRLFCHLISNIVFPSFL